jgi:putative oxidoreductase
MTLFKSTFRGLSYILRFLNRFAPLADLLIRAWIFKVFFFAGLLKLKTWQSTLFLFENEYDVPLLPAEVAAYIGTAAEIILPALLLIGLFGRLAATALFVFNITVVISYPYLWTPDGLNGLYQHITWGIMILVTMVYGPGKYSLDYVINRRYPQYEY